jgi:hypothetical protein
MKKKRNGERASKPKIRERKLRRGVNWQGVLKKKKQGYVCNEAARMW